MIYGAIPGGDPGGDHAIPVVGQIAIVGKPTESHNPCDARKDTIETICRTLRQAADLDTAATLFSRREVTTAPGFVDDTKMEIEIRKIMGRLNPNLWIFDARILIMDEPATVPGPQETAMVAERTQEPKALGPAIFLIGDAVHRVKQLCDRAAMMTGGDLVGIVNDAAVS